MGRAAEALCAFLNARGGSVLVGVSPDRKIVGQLVNDSTLQDVAQVLKRLDPSAPIQIHGVPVPDSGHEVLVLEANASHESRTFTFDGRPCAPAGPSPGWCHSKPGRPLRPVFPQAAAVHTHAEHAGSIEGRASILHLVAQEIEFDSILHRVVPSSSCAGRCRRGNRRRSLCRAGGECDDVHGWYGTPREPGGESAARGQPL